MRDAFVKTLEEEAEKNENIVVLTGDLGFSVFESFEKKFPGRFFNCGISEQNMMGMAAGLSLLGKTVIVYSIIPFVTLRCLEQIRNDICYSDLKVIIVGVGSGLSYGSSGFSHQANEDIGCLKSIPNLTILSPCDPNEVQNLFKESLFYNHPVYLRLGKNKEERFNLNQRIKIGELYCLKRGKNVALITHGSIIEEVISAGEKLKEKGISPTIFSCPTIKPLNELEVKKILKEYSNIFVIEEHNTIGGLGDSICSIGGNKINKIAIKDHFIYTAGDKQYLRKREQIDSGSICQYIIENLKNEN